MGTTYPRRAKQLVRNGRAVWLEEGQTLQLTAEPDSTPPVTIEEEAQMDDKMYPTNGKAKTYTSDHTEESDDLLMYLAKKNVREKRNLGWHVLAFIIALIILGTLFGVNHTHSHPMSSQIRGAINNVQSIQSYVPVDSLWHVGNAIGAMERVMFSHIPSVLYMLSGALILWGAWIVVRAAKIFRRKKKSAKPDPVLLEYKRLKDTIDLR